MLTSRQPIWIGWGKDLIKLYNDPYRAILAGKHPWALGRPAGEVWKEVWHEIGPMLDQAMRGDEGTYVESQLLLMERNGYPEETYYTFSYTPIPGDQGGTAGIICANTDDTARILAERQLQTLQLLGNIETKNTSLGEVLRAARAVLCKNDRDFPYVIVYGVEGTEARLVAGDGAGVFPPEVNLEVIGDISNAYRLKESLLGPNNYPGRIPKGPWHIEAERLLYAPIIPAGGEYPRAILVAALNPHRRQDESFVHFAKLVIDQITVEVNDVLAYEKERKRAEALAEIDRAKTIFFSNISHEFRTPLTLLLGPIEDALHDVGTSIANHERLDIAHRNALRLQKLVNSLLDFSRIEAKRMRVNMERVDLAQLTRDIASSFEPIMKKALLDYIVDCPPFPEKAAVDVDMWENIILNLVSNAFKYTKEGRVEVRLVQKTGGIELSVADTGVGIPDSEQGKIFERFHRVENIHGRTQEGTGIGLSLVRELVRLHHGDIWVTSLLGKGSVFTVYIPQSGSTAFKEGDSHQHTRRIAAFTEEAGKWIDTGARIDGYAAAELPLVVVADDNADMRDYIYRLMQGRFRVILATNGEEGFEAVTREKPDLILSDIMMPRMDGFAFLEATRRSRETRNIPFIFLSARAGEEARLEGFLSGADDYLVKPFSGKELIVKAEASIRIARARQAAERDLYNLFMQTPVGIAVYGGRSLVIELVNDTMLQYWGRRRGDAQGTPLWDLLPEAREQGFDVIAENVYRTGIGYMSPETPVQLWKDHRQETLYARFAFEPRRDEMGNTIGLLGIAYDVTEQVLARKGIQASEERYRDLAGRLETLVREQTAELRRSNEDLQQFAHVASHDLKEPVRKLLVFGGRLREEFRDSLPERAMFYLNRMDAAAARMSAMIEGVLLYSTLEGAELSVKPVDLQEVLHNIKADLEVVIADKKAVIEFDDLPVIAGTPFLIYQLFYNLVSNALKFSKKGVPPRIRIEALQGLGSTITVSDNGIGFKQSYASEIFKTFSRLNSKDAYEGTGLGLALCRKIVERHGGSIRAEGEEGVGARFVITLPAS